MCNSLKCSFPFFFFADTNLHYIYLIHYAYICPPYIFTTFRTIVASVEIFKKVSFGIFSLERCKMLPFRLLNKRLNLFHFEFVFFPYLLSKIMPFIHEKPKLHFMIYIIQIIIILRNF